MAISKINIEKKKTRKDKTKSDERSQYSILQSAKETEKKLKAKKDHGDDDAEVFTEWE